MERVLRDGLDAVAAIIALQTDRRIMGRDDVPTMGTTPQRETPMPQKRLQARDVINGPILAVAVVQPDGADDLYVLRQDGFRYRWSLVSDEIVQVTQVGNTFAEATRALRESCGKRLHKLVVC